MAGERPVTEEELLTRIERLKRVQERTAEEIRCPSADGGERLEDDLVCLLSGDPRGRTENVTAEDLELVMVLGGLASRLSE